MLTKADFGLQDLVSTAIVILSLFLILGMDSGVLLHYYDASDNDKEKIRSTWLWFELFVSLPVCALLWIFAETVCNFILSDSTIAPYFRLGVLAVPFSLVTGAILLVLRLTFQTKKFIILTTVGVFFQVVSAILLVVVWKMGVRGIFLSILIANALQMLLGLCLTAKMYRIDFSFSWLKKMLIVGIPLVPAALSLWILNYSNRLFLTRYDSLSDIGMLSVAMRISSILLFVLSAFSTAWGPFAYSLVNDKSLARRTFSKVLTYFLLFSIFSAVFLSMFAREVTSLLATSAYEGAAPLVSLYCFSSIFWVVLYIVGMGAGIAKKTYHNTYAIVGGALVNTALNFLLIPIWGITGAAVATLAGNFVAMFYMYFAGQHYFHVEYEFKKVFPLIISSVAAIVFGIILDSYYALWNMQLLSFKLAVSMLFIGSLFLFRVIHRDSIYRGWLSMRSIIKNKMKTAN